MGVFNTFRMVGLGLGPVVAGIVVSAGPYRILGTQLSGFDAAFYIASAGAVLSVILVSLLISDPDVDPKEEADAGESFSIAVFDRVGDNLLDPVFTLGLATVAMAICITVLEPLQPQVNSALEQGATLFGVEFAAFTITQVFFQATIGRWSDEYGRRRFILGGLALLAPATLVQGFITTSLGMIAARFIQGVAGAAVLAPSMALAGDIAQGRNSGTTLSVLTMAFGIGAAIGPLSAGYLTSFNISIGQDYLLVFVFGTVLALISVGLVYTQVEETVDTDIAHDYQNSEGSPMD